MFHVEQFQTMILKQFNVREVACQGYAVQFTMPVDNPVDNVRLIREQRRYIFEVPINHPAIHCLTFADLVREAARCEDIRLIHRS